jgi:Transglycosylase-like domain
MVAAASATQVSASDVAQEILAQGGSKAQAWVGAALVSGIESNGQANDKNPTSTACGLFQFLTTTWISNGGGQYAPTACAAGWQQQVAVFLTASAGSNFYPWAPDLGGSYNGNTSQAAATTPQAGSAVANKIASLAASGLAGILGNVPTNWADAGAATPANPAPGPLGAIAGLATGGTSVPNVDPLTALGTFVGDLLGGFGIGWKAVLTIIGGILLIGVGLLIAFRHQAGQAASVAAMA